MTRRTCRAHWLLGRGQTHKVRATSSEPPAPRMASPGRRWGARSARSHLGQCSRTSPRVGGRPGPGPEPGALLGPGVPASGTGEGTGQREPWGLAAAPGRAGRSRRARERPRRGRACPSPPSSRLPPAPSASPASPPAQVAAALGAAHLSRAGEPRGSRPGPRGARGAAVSRAGGWGRRGVGAPGPRRRRVGAKVKPAALKGAAPAARGEGARDARRRPPRGPGARHPERFGRPRPPPREAPRGPGSKVLRPAAAAAAADPGLPERPAL